MDPDPSSLTFFAILALLAANAFLVAAEFALIAVRRTRIEQNVRHGDALAARVLPALDRLEELVFAAQVARSAASVGLGYFAFRAGREYLLPLFGPGRTVSVGGVALASTGTAATALAVGVVVLLHATLGQQAPKLVAIHRAEWITAHLAVTPLRVLALVLRPLLWPLGWLVRGVVRLFGVHSTGFHPLMQTQEEIRLLVERASDQADIEDEEREMIRGVFEISETAAREVMTPRTSMVAVPVGATLDELARVAAEEGHSRIPVYEGTVDSILGIVLTKDLLPILQARRNGAGPDEPFDIRSILRPAYFVPDTKPVDDLLHELRQQAVHLAIVLDEFGGTYGLVTMEDLLEEIVGEINDEYDVAGPEFASTPEGDVLIDGAAHVFDVNERFGLLLPEEEFDTVGGFVFGTLGRVPVAGDVVAAPAREGGRELRVEAVEERRVTRVRLCSAAPVPDAVASE